MPKTATRPAARVPKFRRWAGPLFDGHKCSLGYAVIDWLRAYACHGPGDVQGQPWDPDDEFFRFLVNAYELDPATGRRMVDRALLSRPKGRAKSELAGLVVVAEAYAEVRFDGWDASGQPVGHQVVSPLIKCLAPEELQAGHTFENAAFIAGEWGPDMHPEIYAGTTGVRRYQSASAVYVPGGGEIRASTAGAASKDGGKETFVVPDEVHLYVTPETRSMYATVGRNTGKRALAMPWMLATTTMYRSGQESVAEKILTAHRKGKLGDRWLVDHREARGRIDINDREHTLRQLREVYGAATLERGGWVDVESVYRIMLDPNECEDEATAARYFLNREKQGADAWIDKAIVDRQMTPPADVERIVRPGTPIALGFDGSWNDDSTVLFGSRMSDGFLFPLGIWEKPDGPEGIGWSVPRLSVLATIREAHQLYVVSRGYYDPHEWRSDIDTLAEDLGEDRVISWETRRDVQMAAALDRLRTDLVKGETWMARSKIVLEHFANAYKMIRGKLTLVRKEHPKSARKIDSVPAATLAYEARADAIADGWTADPPDTRVIVLS